MKLLDTGRASADRNMAIDSELLASIGSAEHPILHLYEWDGPSATYGYFAKPEELIDVEAARELGYTLARRPTGGGLLLHTCDFAFSVLVPASHPSFSKNTLDNYGLINRQVAVAIERLTEGKHLPSIQACPKTGEKPRYCMAKATCYDLVLEGKKVAGAAQRQTRRGFLHQGSISLTLPTDLERLVGEATAERMREQSFPLFRAEELEAARNQLSKIIVDTFLNNPL